MKSNGKENKKMVSGSKISMMISVILLMIASFNMLKHIYDGRDYSRDGLFVIIGLTLLATSFMNIKRYKAESEGKTIADERSRRAVVKAGLFAFLLLIVMLIISGVANSAFNLGLEYTMTVNVILFACIFAWMGLTHYLDKKGDV